jgi:hypothetical protein
MRYAASRVSKANFTPCSSHLPDYAIQAGNRIPDQIRDKL